MITQLNCYYESATWEGGDTHFGTWNMALKIIWNLEHGVKNYLELGTCELKLEHGTLKLKEFYEPLMHNFKP